MPFDFQENVCCKKRSNKEVCSPRVYGSVELLSCPSINYCCCLNDNNNKKRDRVCLLIACASQSFDARLNINVRNGTRRWKAYPLLVAGLARSLPAWPTYSSSQRHNFLHLDDHAPTPHISLSPVVFVTVGTVLSTYMDHHHHHHPSRLEVQRLY